MAFRYTDVVTVPSQSLQLLLIAMTDIAIADQLVKGDASTEGLSNPGGCISDWRGLKKAYLDRQSSAKVENSIFNFYPNDTINYDVLAMFYDVGPPPNISTSGRRKCCQRGSKYCIIHFIYRFRIFRYISPQLLLVCAGHRTFNTSGSRDAYEIAQLCMSPPSLCSNSQMERDLQEFSKQVYSKCYSHTIV